MKGLHLSWITQYTSLFSRDHKTPQMTRVTISPREMLVSQEEGTEGVVPTALLRCQAQGPSSESGSGQRRGTCCIWPHPELWKPKQQRGLSCLTQGEVGDGLNITRPGRRQLVASWPPSSEGLGAPGEGPLATGQTRPLIHSSLPFPELGTLPGPECPTLSPLSTALKVPHRPLPGHCA